MVIMVSHKLPFDESQTWTCDNCTTRKSAPFRVRAKFEPLSAPLQSGIRFLRVLLPTPPTDLLADCLPSRIGCTRLAVGWAYHVPVPAGPMFWVCPLSACLFPGSALDGVPIHHRWATGYVPFGQGLSAALAHPELRGLSAVHIRCAYETCLAPHTARRLAVSIPSPSPG